MQTQPTKTNAPNYRIPPRTPLPSHLPLIFGVLGVLSWRITRTFFLEFMTPRFRNLLPGEMRATYLFLSAVGFHPGGDWRQSTISVWLYVGDAGCFTELSHASPAIQSGHFCGRTGYTTPSQRPYGGSIGPTSFATSYLASSVLALKGTAISGRRQHNRPHSRQGAIQGETG